MKSKPETVGSQVGVSPWVVENARQIHPPGSKPGGEGDKLDYMKGS